MLSVLVALVLGQVAPLGAGGGGAVQPMAICTDGQEVSCTKTGCKTATKICNGVGWGTCTCRDNSCNDNNACTTDGWIVGDASCSHTPVSTDDGNACTTDACNTTTGAITHTARTGAACNDENACTTGDVCTAEKSCAGALTCTAAATYLCHDKFGQLTKKIVCVQGQSCDSRCP